ncbi:lipoprotein-releasing ABC transporter ATP-binding protein LolD [bacterium]|nr:lipoprotein-releasing ABC transporter ATP-binding protein LolD [bacterium]
MRDATQQVISARGLCKSYRQGRLAVDVLDDVDLDVAPGELVAVVGASGSGKSTLLHLLGGLDTATAGTVHVAGQNMTALGDAARGKLRNAALGFVYQFHHLLPEFTAAENVALPLILRRGDPDVALKAAEDLLARVGLAERSHHKPSELSGGERQRAAVARALITKPACVLADEPTGNLDHANAESVFELMLELNAEQGTSLIVVTHDTELAARMQRRFTLLDGKLQPAE